MSIRRAISRTLRPVRCFFQQSAKQNFPVIRESQMVISLSQALFELVQGAWSWVRLDRHAAKTYRRLVRNTGCPQMAIVGMARRMAIDLWCMLVREHAYQPLGA